MSVRTAGGWQPRFGRGRIVQTLVGSRSREIIDARLDQLSTYGLLKAEGVAYSNQLLRELQDSGLLVSTGGQYPMVTLTVRGEEIMKGALDYALRWPQRVAVSEMGRSRKAKAKSIVSPDLLPADVALFEQLKKLRSKLARENGNLPAYIIFPDETLRAFARLKPRSVEAGRKIRGVGDLKAQKYLPAFLETIEKFDSE